MSRYDLLLRLLPRSFREQYGSAMADTFRLRLAAAREQGRLATLRLCASETVDLLLTTIRTHARGGRPAGSRNGFIGLTMLGVVEDGRVSVRGMTRQPVFAVTAVGTLALGIGGVAVMWTVVHHVLLAPLPYHEPDRLVRVFVDYTRQPARPLTPPVPGRGPMHQNHYLEIVDRTPALESLGLVDFDLRTVRTQGGALEHVNVGLVTANVFEMLGVRPTLGRGFLAGEDRRGAEPVVVLSHQLWQNAFGGGDVLGRTVAVDGIAHEVVGVMPADFRLYLNPVVPGEVIRPVGVWVAAPIRHFANGGDAFLMHALGKLAPGATHARAEAEVGSILRNIETVLTKPAVVHDVPSEDLANVVPLHDHLYASVDRRLRLSLIAAIIVLAMACLNVTNVLLSRIPGRTPELATRAALGASRSRLLQLMIVEAVALALIAALVGAALAWGALRLIRSFGPSDVPRMAELSIDTTVLAYCAGLALLCAVVVGVAPALRGSLAAPMMYLRRWPAGLSRGSAHVAVIGGQLAVALILLTSAGLLVQSAIRLSSIDLGVRPEGAVAARLAFPDEVYADMDMSTEVRQEMFLRFVEQTLSRIESRPEVAAAAMARWLPLHDGERNVIRDSVGGDQAPAVLFNAVTPRYFEILGIELRQGRLFSDEEVRSGRRVRVVNEAWGRSWSGGRSVVGLENHRGSIVGVVRDHYLRDYRVAQVADTTRPMMYLPLSQASPNQGIRFPDHWLVVQPRESDLATVAAITRETIRSVDHRVAVFDVQPIDASIHRALQPSRFHATLSSLLAFLGVCIAAGGVFGVLAFMVSQRSHEIGVRMALGADRGEVVAMFVRRVGAVALGGIAVGVVGALAAGRALQAWLFEIEPADPMNLFGAAMLLFTVAVLAAWIPVRRATNIDPASILKAE